MNERIEVSERKVTETFCVCVCVCGRKTRKKKTRNTERAQRPIHDHTQHPNYRASSRRRVPNSELVKHVTTQPRQGVSTLIAFTGGVRETNHPFPSR